VKDKRTCAYCGGNHNDGTCKCTYRHKRKRIDGLNGGFYVECSNISAQTTLAEMLESIRQTLSISIKNPDKVLGTWRWSFDKAEPLEKKTKRQK
jgi:hypothetical protein